MNSANSSDRPANKLESVIRRLADERIDRRWAGRSSAKIVALTLLLIGVIFGGVGLMFAYPSWSLLSSAVRADGKVIRMARNMNNENRGAAPVVEFHVEGARHEFQSWLYVSPPQYSVGDQVTVLFDPRHVQKAAIESFTDLWLFPTIFGGIGGVLAIAGCVIFVIASWPRASVPAPDAGSKNYLD